MRLSRSPSTTRLLLLVLLAILLISFAMAIVVFTGPGIDSEFGGASIHITVDRGLIVTPGGCARIKWNVEGIQSIYFDGVGKIGWGDELYCPETAVQGLQVEITAQDGMRRTLLLEVRNFHLPLAFQFLMLFLLSLMALSALYYAVTHRIDAAPPISLLLMLIAALLALTGFMTISSDPAPIDRAIGAVRSVFVNPSWQEFGLALGALVFIPLGIGALRRGIRSGARHDFIAVSGFFLFLVLLYVPFGIESSGHWEEWVVNAWFEGRPSKLSTELIGRFWVLLSHTLAYLISSESFIGYHLVALLMIWSQLLLLYRILRSLRFGKACAFLATMLFMVYPVNSHMMSLRSIGIHLSVLALLAAVHLMLDYLNHPSRLRLLGIWLALLFNITQNETAYVLILVAPIVWWWRDRRLNWRNVNLTAIWYLFPAAKVAFLLLLYASGRDFYGLNQIGGNPDVASTAFDPLAHYAGIVGKVYQQTFVAGWQEAISALGRSEWLAPIFLSLGLIGLAAIYLSRECSGESIPPRRQAIIALLAGLLLIMPAVGVLMWLERYNQDLWRMYIYVPIGAAIAVIGLLQFLLTAVKNPKTQRILFLIVCLALMLPASARLYAQHARFVNSANTKAKILRQIVEQAPYLDKNARLMMITRMSTEDLEQRQLIPFRQNMFDSALYVLYDESRPQVAFLCIVGEGCNIDDIDIAHNYLGDVKDFGDVVMFRLHEDLSVEFLRELPDELRDQQIENYNPDRLIDASAPLPPRAVTMLGSVLNSE